MPNVILPNLGIELPDVGSDQDTWGDILNADLEILDLAVQYDVISKTLSNVDVTLTAAEAASAVIDLSGTLTANVNVIVPATPVRVYLVRNQTSGAFTVTVKTAAGTGTPVQQGTSSLVYSDGTNIIQGATSVNGSFAVSGALSAGSATVTGALSTGSVSTASATITGGSIANTPISGSTGSFTTLSASGATTLNGAVTLGDAAADAITVTGTATFAQAAQFPDGTAALPAITNTGDTNTGIYFPDEDVVGESTGGVERRRTTSAGYSKFSNNGVYRAPNGAQHEFVANTISNLVCTTTISTTNSTVVQADILSTNNTNTNLFLGTNNDGAATVYKVLGNGTVQNSTGLYQTISDRRVKDQIQPLTNSGAFIDALQPKTWTWLPESQRTGTGQGFIADEFQQVCPDSVTGQPDAVDEEGNPVYQAIDPSTSEMIANLVAEVQSLRRRVAALEGAAP